MVALIGFFGLPFSQQIPALARNVLQQVADTEELVAARTGGLYLAQGIGALIAALFVSAFSTLRRKRFADDNRPIRVFNLPGTDRFRSQPAGRNGAHMHHRLGNHRSIHDDEHADPDRCSG